MIESTAPKCLIQAYIYSLNKKYISGIKNSTFSNIVSTFYNLMSSEKLEWSYFALKLSNAPNKIISIALSLCGLISPRIPFITFDKPEAYVQLLAV